MNAPVNARKAICLLVSIAKFLFIDCDETASVVEISAHLAEAILVPEGHQGYLRPKTA
jgi:hypothetical protein